MAHFELSTINTLQKKDKSFGNVHVHSELKQIAVTIDRSYYLLDKLDIEDLIKQYIHQVVLSTE